MDVMNVLTRHIIDAKYEDLPPLAVDTVKKVVLDVLGTTLAGSTAAGCRTVVDLVKEWGGKEECSIMVYGGKVPAPNAAMANCVMARALDFDDVHEVAGLHPSVNAVPNAFVLSEYSGRPVSGKEFILAVALGADLQCRLREALFSRNPGWLGEVFAPFGVVAIGGKLLGFNQEQLLNGMGLAYAQCASNAQAIIDGTLAVRLQQGFSAKAGVLATILAQRGLTGVHNVIEGKYGFYPLYFPRSEYDLKILTDELGKRFEGTYVSIKPYPSGRGGHPAIYGTLELVKEHDIRPEDVAGVHLATATYLYNLLVYSEGGENKYRPQSVMDAQFSIPYTMALAIVKRKVFIDDFTEEAIRDPRVLEVASKVKVDIDPELDKLNPVVVPNTIEITTRDGRRYSKTVQYGKGHPENPMTMAEVVEKFRNCAAFSARPVSRVDLDEIIRRVDRLEESKDVRDIIKLMV